jgi:hypothetical protein
VTAQAGLQIDDAIVLLLGAPWKHGGGDDGKLEGVTRLEKLIFLLEQETSAKNWLTEDPEFVPHNFGPFSAKVYQAIDLLVGAEIIEDSASPAQTDEDTWEEENVIGASFPLYDRYITRDLSLTARGWKYYQALTQELPKGALEELIDFKDRFATIPLRQLVRYVYQKPEYEPYTEKSVIRSDVLR